MDMDTVMIVAQGIYHLPTGAWRILCHSSVRLSITLWFIMPQQALRPFFSVLYPKTFNEKEKLK